MTRPLSFLLLWGALPLCAADLVAVQRRAVPRTTQLPGEFLPYESVPVQARVNGYVERIAVDRGSVVKQGQLLVELSAPELSAQLAEAESKVQFAQAGETAARARLTSLESVGKRLQDASQVTGAVAGNELTVAQQNVAAARAEVQAQESATRAARANVAAIRELAGFRRVTAPFSGVIAERYVHPGALVGPNSGPLLKLEQTARLRLLVPVPEAAVARIPRGTAVNFTVPAFPGDTFHATVARVARTLDPKTRTMIVECDFANPRGTLAPGMYPTIAWPTESGEQTLLVPLTAVVTTTERVFVIRARDGNAEYVRVKKGRTTGELIEVIGPLQPGDKILRRASDEVREGKQL